MNYLASFVIALSLLMRSLMLFILGITLLFAYSLEGQELRASVRIQAEQLPNTKQSELKELERVISELLNTTKWTDKSYLPEERIDCQLTLRLLSLEDDRRYTAELTLSVRRPVYETSYTTSLLVHRDKAISFDYSLGESLVYKPQSLEHPLVAVLAFYAQYIIAWDRDSFAPLGGNALLSSLTQTLSLASGQWAEQGWQDDGSQGSRAELVKLFTDQAHEAFRLFQYRYHRWGLDRLSSEASQARAELLTQMERLLAYKREYPYTPWLGMIEQSKYEELRRLFSLAPSTGRARATTLLEQLSPSSGL